MARFRRWMRRRREKLKASSNWETHHPKVHPPGALSSMSSGQGASDETKRRAEEIERLLDEHEVRPISSS